MSNSGTRTFLAILIGTALLISSTESDLNACSYIIATADILVYWDPESGETIEVNASYFDKQGVVVTHLENCEYIGEKDLCLVSGEGS